MPEDTPSSYTFDAAQLVRPHIRSMPAYEPILPFEVLSRQLGRPASEIVKLDANENPYGMIEPVRQALAELEFGHVYPDPQSTLLRHALAEHFDLPVELLITGAGADDLIDLLLRVCAGPGEAVINCPPTFGMYRFDADLNGCEVIDIPRRADFSLDLPAILEAAGRSAARLIFLASPNNPDGSLAPAEVIERLLELPALLVLDEAYIEFATAGASRLQEVPRRANLAVLRTFSKWAGLAGLRVGYGAFPASLAPHLWKARQPYNVSAAASAAALAALEHRPKLAEIGEWLLEERGRMAGLLAQVPYLRPYPSQANFILCRVTDRPARQLKQALAEQAVLVRYFNKPGLENCIRISVGRPQDTDRLLEALNRLAGSPIGGETHA